MKQLIQVVCSISFYVVERNNFLGTTSECRFVVHIPRVVLGSSQSHRAIDIEQVLV